MATDMKIAMWSGSIGGPHMTIETLGVGMAANKVLCVWFDGKKKDSGAFHPDALELAEK